MHGIVNSKYSCSYLLSTNVNGLIIVNLIYKSKCLSVSLSVVSYARRHLWADPDETLQGNLGGPSDDMGVGCGTIPTVPPGTQFQKGCSGSCNHGIILFPMSL